MNVYCLVFDGFSDWEIGYVLPELRKNGVNVITLGFDAQPVESMGGLQIVPHILLSKANAEEADLLIIPGGERWHNAELADEMAEVLGEFHSKNIAIAAICGGTITLARAGLLNDCRHTSNLKEYLQDFSKENYSGDNYVEELAASDRNIITASGLGSLEFTLEVLKVLSIYPVEQCEAWFHFFKGTTSTTA